MKKLGVIADDFTGAPISRGSLLRGTWRPYRPTVFPLPTFPFRLMLSSSAEIALLPEGAGDRGLMAALRWLRRGGANSSTSNTVLPLTRLRREHRTGHGCTYGCSGTDLTIVCPALPVNGRTLYKGYLFVNDELLHESGMRSHPLTPMRDSKIERVMESQSRGEARQYLQRYHRRGE